MTRTLRTWRDRVELARKAERRKHLTLLPSPHEPADSDEDGRDPTDEELAAWMLGGDAS